MGYRVHDPREDTERPQTAQTCGPASTGYRVHDPREDTERTAQIAEAGQAARVTESTIRERILKDREEPAVRYDQSWLQSPRSERGY